MHLSRRIVELSLVLILTLIGGLVLMQPTAVQGAPPYQPTPPPRPTVAPPQPPPSTSTSPLPSVPIHSEIALALAVDKHEAYPGEVLTYKAQVDNVAGQEATNVWLTCDLPHEVHVEEVTTTTGAIHRYGRRVSFELGRFGPGHESQYMSIATRILDDTAPGKELVHHANLTSDQAGGGERSVMTLVLGEAPESPPEQVQDTIKESPLPTTGNRAIPLWLSLGFVAFIAIAALFSMRERPARG